MVEYWIAALIIILFLLLSFLRSFFKRYWSLDGLVWLPVLSFFLILGFFPAYGFRPEFVPLLAYSFLLNIANIPLLIESASSSGDASSSLDDRGRDHGIVLPFIEFVLLIIVCVPVYVFAPKIPLALLTDGVEKRMIHNESATYSYLMRIYSPQFNNGGLTPIIFLAPPEAGSVYAVDRICWELMEQGFTVISYSRRGFDFPAEGEEKKRYVSPVRINAMWQAFRKGTENTKANERGKFLESERQKDIEFLLPLVCRNMDEKGVALIPGFHANEGLPVFVVGYGAAGSAAAYLFEQPVFSSLCANVKGIAAIESRLWSAYQEASQRPLGRRRTGAANVVKADAVNVLEAKWLPQPGISILYMVSDKAFDSGQSGNNSFQEARRANQEIRRNPYRAVLDTFRNSSSPIALAAFDGAGPFAYNDYFLTHPAYLFLFPGEKKNAEKSETPVVDASGYIGNFFLMLLQQEDVAMPEDEFDEYEEFPAPEVFNMPDKWVISSPVLVERRDMPAF